MLNILYTKQKFFFKPPYWVNREIKNFYFRFGINNSKY